MLSPKIKATESDKKLADYGVAFDLLATIAVYQNEGDVIRKIVEVFDSICAPQYIAYLPRYGEKRGEMLWHPSTPDMGGAIDEKLALFKDEYAWTASEKGFILGISHGGQTLGVIQIEGMAFPEYREHYLNLAINTAQVIGLAIANARAYQSLESLVNERTEKLRAMNRDLAEEIEERKKMEEKLRQAKDLAEEATKLKDKFLSLVSHDLKSPLASMVGLLKNLRFESSEPLDIGARMMLDGAIDLGAGMSRLIDELLNIGRLKTGAIKLKMEFFDANLIGTKMVTDYSHAAAQKEITLVNKMPPNTRIYADKDLLCEAVQNLVTNAIKFCGKGDAITLFMPDDGNPSICVRDTGPGINRPLLEKIFSYEEKTSTRGTGGETGTGLGLPLAREIMGFHGGGLTVQSEPGKGSLFCATLPFVRPKILLVDDDPSFRFLLKEYLKMTNADIIEAGNGKEAWAKIATEPPHLVITDIKMPEMDGLELLDKIKKGAGTSSLPVIVVTGEYGMEIRDTIFRMGAEDFATKEINTEDFIPRVRRFIG